MSVANSHASRGNSWRGFGKKRGEFSLLSAPVNRHA
jgi:hypothetical protein